MKKAKLAIMLLMAALLAASCTGNAGNTGNTETGGSKGSESENAAEKTQSDKTAEPLVTGIDGTELTVSEEYLLELASETLEILATGDWGALGGSVHPTQGLAFVPYGYVQEDAVRLGIGDVKAIGYDESVRVWGQFDGSGLPIEYTFEEYFDRFIMSHDFRHAPQISIGRIIRSTVQDNLFVFGNGAEFVEFHFPEGEQYGEFEWASLRIVFSPYEGDLYLVAIVHEEWTI
ncbi:MAG: hypothetical protein FWG30_05710 [Eubacteriaceae bacterium]|nr:hypothetical protein [Eubacteriaceae bacterium]